MAKQESEPQQLVAIATICALALRGGCSVTSALEQATSGAKGQVATALRRSLQLIDLGTPAGLALEELKLYCASPAADEFVGKLQAADAYGSALADQLDDYAETLRGQVAVSQLARATASETKMLLPLVFLILPVTVLFALYPSLQILNLQMEGI